MRLALGVAMLCASLAAAQDLRKPGIAFQGEDIRKLQADDFANPGMNAVANGERLWGEKLGSGPPCAQCHKPDAMKGVAARYPQFQPKLGRVVNLEGRIDACHREHQQGAGLAPESEQRLALSAYITHQSRGLPIAVETSGRAAKVLKEGERLYNTRIGQMNLACTHCHDAMAGRTLLAEPISQGHPGGWPAYRLEWQSLGSLQRRLRACFFGVRAEQPAFGSDDLLALELFLMHRARGMAMEAPGVRR